MGAFPQSLVDYIQEDLTRKKALDPAYYRKAKPHDLVDHVYHIANSFEYGFVGNLQTGIYAPYFNEARSHRISGNNCTTIIPTIYVYADLLGLKPQIVQFFGFQDIVDKDDNDDETGPEGSHFALIVDGGKKGPYLLDPFWRVCGRLRERGEKFMKIGVSPAKPHLKRKFEHLVEYTPEQFAQMMDRLHDPAESLDMLVCGQKTFSEWHMHASKTKGMIYYNDTTEEVSFRLAIPQMGISNKAVIARHKFNVDGSVDSMLELFFAKDYAWNHLVEPRKVASITIVEAERIRILLGRFTKPQTFPRWQQHLWTNSAGTSELFELEERIRGRLSSEDRTRIEPVIFGRTLYENTNPSQEYLFTLEQRAAHYINLNAQERPLLEEYVEMQMKMNYFRMGLVSIPANERRAMVRRLKINNQKRKKIKEEIEQYTIYGGKNRAFHRSMDKVLFARELPRSNDALREMVEQQNMDTRLGYLATIADFIPFVHCAKDYLSLVAFKADLAYKISARRLKKIRTGCEVS